MGEKAIMNFKCKLLYFRQSAVFVLRTNDDEKTMSPAYNKVFASIYAVACEGWFYKAST